MMTAPVSSSIIATSFLKTYISDHYDFEVVTCSLLRAGLNHTYLIHTATSKFVFRVYSYGWRSQLEISEEIRLLNILHTNEVSVSHPIASHSDQYIQTINAPEGQRFGVLFSFAKGEKIHLYPEELHFKIGQLMANFHLLSAKISLQRVTYTPDIVLQQSVQQITRFLSEGSDEMSFLRSTQKMLLTEWKQIDLSKIRHGAVHLDIWFDNLNITKSGAVTLFDFDFCGNGFLILDVAYYILQVTSLEREEAVRLSKIQHFLEGYESVTPLSVEEKRIYPMLGLSLYFFYLGVQCQRFDNWSNTFLNENYLKRFINQLVKRYAEINNLV